VREAGGAYAVDFDLSALAQSPVAPDGALVPVYTAGASAPLLVPIGSGGGGGGAVGAASALAGESLGGHKVLYARSDGTVAVGSSSDVSQAGKIVGLSLAAAVQGATVQYIYFGPIDEPSWSWVPGPVYLGTDGNPTQIYPTVGFVQQIGVASMPTRINMNRESFVILA
jgi:hypothetical protein